MGIKILTKESMPKERYNILGDLGRFQQWWMHNVFDYACQVGRFVREIKVVSVRYKRRQ